MAISALVEQLQTIPDWRRARKVQYPLWLMLLLSLLGVMSGCRSLRGLADFMERHQVEVAEYFALSKQKLPSYATIRRMTQQVEGTRVAQVFRDWARQEYPIASGTAVAMDGKALGSTHPDCHGQHQDYVTVVSACVHEYGWVVAQASFNHRVGSEIASVRQLIEHLDIKGAWLTLDALHCQKNSA
jgi:hypothetical protein